MRAKLLMKQKKLVDKKVLITGGAGFIGSNLCEYFVADNQVVCLDNLSTGFRKNIEPLLNHPNFTFIKGDITNLEDCKKALEGCDYVFHQAALGSVPRSINDPIGTNRNNIDGFLNMLVAARDAHVKRFIYAVSSSTYGDHQALPKVEENIGSPLSPYAVTKRVNELYAKVFSDLYGMETIGLRYFNVFGKRQDPEGAYAAVIPRFVASLLDGQSPVINGDGTQSRDFTHISNVLLANELAATVEAPEALNQVYNVACQQRTDLNTLFEMLRNTISKTIPEVASINVLHGPTRFGDVEHSWASVEKGKRWLGYEPVTLIKDGLERTIDYYVQIYSSQS